MSKKKLVLGKWTGRYTKEGRKIYKNNRGGESSEYTIGVKNPKINGGKLTHIPSIYNGKIVDQETAEKYVIESKGKDRETGRFIDYGGDPETRSKSLGNQTMTREEKIKRMVQQMIDSGVTTDWEQARESVLQELRKPGGEEWLDRNLERGIDTQGFDEIGQGDDLTNEQKRETLKKELNIGEGDPDFLYRTEDRPFEEWRDRFADPKETEEDRLERQIDYFNSLRDHVSDSDMGYMQQQDPESLYSQGRDVDNTMIVEALQRRAMEQGSPAQTAGIPLGMDGQSILPQNPMDQQLRDMSGVGRQAQQLQNTPQQADLMELQRQMQMKAMENIRMQTLAAGGGQGIGRQMSWDRWQ